MEEQDINLLLSQGYTYNSQGYITDVDGNFVKSVTIAGRTLNSAFDENHLAEAKKQSEKLDAINFVPNEDSTEDVYVQQQRALDTDNLNKFIAEPDKTVLNKGAFTEDAFNNLKVNGGIDENTVDALEKNKQSLSEDVVIRELDAVAPENINELKEIRSEISKLQGEDPDVDTKQQALKDSKVTSNVWGVGMLSEPEEDGSFVDKANYAFAKGANNALSSIIQMVSPTGAGITDEKKKKRYKELVAKEIELSGAAIKNREDKIDKDILEAEALYNTMREKDPKLQGSVLPNLFGDQADAILVEIDAMKRRKDELENYRDYKNQNVFMRDFYHNISEAGGKSLRSATFADTAHFLKNVYFATQKVKDGTASEADKTIVKSYAAQAEHDEFLGNLPSLGAVHDTVEGISGSLGFMAEMFTGGLGKKGATKALEKTFVGKGAKYIDEGVAMAAQAINSVLPKSLKPVARMVGKVGTIAKDAAVIPLGMGSTYSGAFKNAVPVLYDEATDKFLVQEKVWDYENTSLDARKVSALEEFDRLSEKKKLSPEEQEDLKYTMSFLNIDGEVNGVKRSKSVPTYDELKRDLVNVGWGSAFYDSYTKNISEVASEKAGELGIGKSLGKIKINGKSILDNQLGRFFTETNKKVNKASGGYIHSLFDEQLEENLVPLLNYGFQGRESELYSMMSLDAQKDVAIQTLAMNMLFRIPGAIQSVATEEGREERRRRKEFKEENKIESKRLSGLYRDIAQADIDTDLTTIVDLTAIPGSDNSNTVNQIKLLKAQGKEVEARALTESLFSYNLAQAVRTGTVDDFEESIHALARRINKQTTPGEVGLTTMQNIVNAQNSIKKFKEYTAKYGDKIGATDIVHNLMSRDANVRELGYTKWRLEENKKQSKEEFDLFEENFKSEYEAFVHDGTKKESIDSGRTMLEKRFEDPQVQKEYTDLVIARTKILSPGMKAIVETSLATVNALKSSIQAQDRVHIELTSDKKQNFMAAKAIANRELNRAFKGKYGILSNEEMGKILNDLDPDVKRVLDKTDIEGIKTDFLKASKKVDAERQALDYAKTQKKVAVAAQEISPEVKPNEEKSVEENSIESKEEGDALNRLLEDQERLKKEMGDEIGPEMMSRRGIRDEEYSPERKVEATRLVNALALKLQEELGHTPTLTDFINYFIKSGSYEKAEANFNGYVKVWEVSGRDASNSQAVFDNIFKDVGTLIDNFIETGFVTPDEIVETVIPAIAQEVAETQGPVLEYDESGAPTTIGVMESFLGEDARTNNPAAKAAHNHLDSKRVGDTEWQVVSTNLIDDKVVANHYILLSDFLQEGDNLSVKINDSDDAVITANNADGTMSTMTWGQYKALNKGKIEPGSALYQNKVPMVAYKTIDGVDVPVFHLHDIGWYNTKNISLVQGEAKQKEVIDAGRTEIANIRQNVLSGNNKLTIDKRAFGSIDTLRDHTDKTLKSLNETTGDTKIVILVDGELYDKLGAGKKPVDMELVNDMNKTNDAGKKIFGNGQIFELRQVGIDQKTKKPQYIALPTITPSPVDYKTLKAAPLNRTAFNNIKFAILANAILNNQDNAVLLKEISKTYGLDISQALEIQKGLIRTTGVDISRSLNEYVDNFIYTHNYSKEVITLDDIATSNNLSRYPTGKTYVKGFNAASSGKGLRGTVNFFLKSAVKEKRGHIQFGEKVDVPKTTSFIQNLDTVLNDATGLLNKTQMHVNAGLLGSITYKDEKMLSIGPKGTITETQGNYENYIKGNLQTNVISHEVKKPDGSTEWVTDVQPMVYYKLATEVKVEPTPMEVKEAQKAVIDKVIAKTTSELKAEAHKKAMDALPTEELKAMYARHIEAQQKRDEELSSRRGRNLEQNDAMANLDTNQITSISKDEQIKLVGSLKNSIINALDFTRKDLSLAEIADNIENSLETFLRPQIANYKQIINNISGIAGLESTVTEFQDKVDKLESIIAEKAKLVSREADNKGSLVVEFERLFGASLEEDLDEENSQEENFSTSFLERDLKLNFSAILKLSLFGIEKLKSNKEKNYNFANLVEYEDADNVLNKLLEVTTNSDSDWDVIMDKLEERYRNREENIFLQLKTKLEAAPEKVKNEILYKTISSKLNMYSVLYEVDTENGSYRLKVLDSNSSKDILKIPAAFERNFLTSNFGQERNTNIVLNKTYAKKALTTMLDNVKKHARTDFKLTKENIALVRNSFETLGIYVNDNTIKKYILNVKASNQSPFDSGALLGTATTFLEKQVNSEDDVIITKDKTRLFQAISGSLQQLVKLEIDLNGTAISKSMRVGGKTMQGVVAKTMVYEMVRELIPTMTNGKLRTGELFNTLANSALSKNNFIINFLKNNETFRDVFSIDFVSLEASKQKGQQVFTDRGVDQLPLVDAMITEIGFSTSKRENVKIELPVKGLNFRIGQMFFPALADKGRMLLLRTALVDIKALDATVQAEGGVALSEPLLDFVSESLFVSELNRILMSYNNEDTNTVGFDKAAKLFLMMPILNTITFRNSQGEDVNIHDYLNGIDPRTGKPNYEQGATEIANAFKPSAKKLISDVINNEISKKVSSDGKSGLWVDAKFYDNEAVNGQKLKHLDTTFLGERGGVTELETIKIAAADFVVNNLLNQANIYQLFLGDMAYFSKDKMIADNELGEIDFKNIDYADLSRKISTVIDKRAAMLIAPGNKLANSDKKGQDDYIQIQVNDVRSMSPIIEKLIETQYGEITENEKALIADIIKNQDDIDAAYATQDYKVVEDVLKPQRKALIKNLSLTNSEISKYFDIEGTDAQEYTTWNNHIDMLMRQGKLTSEEEVLLKSAYDKMSRGKFNEVTPEEIKTVMQPVKPAYTGSMPVYNNKGEIISNRPVYIKSSSFPLIPQLTQGLKLDKVRQHMERLEKESGKMVRMSYQTANKIGAINTSMTMDDLYNKSYEELHQTDEQGAKTGLLAESSLLLKTKNFRIQQETPYKVDKFLKKGEDNSIRMGSQFWKVILGGEINLDDTRAIFPNKFSDELLSAVGVTHKNGMLTGMDLDKIDFFVYNEYSGIQKKAVYDDIGLNEKQPFFNLSVKEQNKVIKKLTDILKDEIVSRGYPDYLQDSIDLVKNVDGTSETEIPIFFDSNSYKFESLLLAVISTKLIEHRLPGSSHISSSSEGFEKTKNQEELTQDIKQGIVWLDGREDGKLKATFLDDGTLVASEVLVQSHYRVQVKDANGKVTKSVLIDLSSNEYSTETKNSKGVVTGRVLNLDKLDPELIAQFSFRIPTSSHQSGVIIKVAGFLPPAAGDLLVVPSEHTVQLGEDYDIDKRYIYKSNYTIAEDGAIVKLNYTADAKPKEKIKMLENAMIDVYKSVYESPDPTIQRNIFQTLSVADAKDTSNWMDEKLQAESKDPLFTPLSDIYQKELIKLGADGKGGIGVHSNAVTLEAQFQRLPRNKKVQLLKKAFEKDADGNTKVVYYPANEVIGNLDSDGELGRVNTIDGDRNIADVHTENQNSSTDNINEQIMGKRNENSTTMSVFAIMAHRGFDKSTAEVNTGLVDEKGNVIKEKVQITSVFMNQPILRDYVALKESYKSMTSGFAANTDDAIIAELVKKYSDSPIEYFAPTDILPEAQYHNASTRMTGQTLWDNLSKNSAQNDIQLAVLQKFMRFKAEADNIREYQQLINLSTSKLGISYFEVIQRIETLNKLATDESIGNIKELVGKSTLPRVTPEENEALIAKGYTLIGDYFWKPTTKEGVMLINSLKTAQDVMSINFPYQEAFVDSTISEIFSNKDIDPHKKSATNLTWKYEIMAAYKDFIYSSNSIGIFSNGVNAERQRLFFDTKGNTSLASFLVELAKNKADIMNNPLISSLVPKVEKTGRPSIIEHVTDANTNFDKSDKYQAFKELLLEDSTVIGVWNGEEVTARDLAQDLATYAYLANDEKGAIGFRNFINLDYFKIMGITKNFRDKLKSIRENQGQEEEIRNKFIKQYFQHYPNKTTIISSTNTGVEDLIIPVGTDEKVTKLYSAAMQNGDISKAGMLFTQLIRSVNSFAYADDEKFHPKYISVRNTAIKLSDNKYNLFELGSDGFYHRIPTLGTFGFNEYNFEVVEQESLIPTPEAIKPVIGNNFVQLNGKNFPMPDVSVTLDLSNGVTSILQQFYNSANTSPEYKKFIKELQDYINPDVKVVIGRPQSGALGAYNPVTNTILIHPDIYQEIANEYGERDVNKMNTILKEVVFEEILHSITANEMAKYIQTNDKNTGDITLVENAPIFAVKLKALYDIARGAVPFDPSNISTYYSQNIYEFMAGMFVSPDYRALVEGRNKGFIKKFQDMLRALLGSLYQATTGNVLAYNDETFKAIYDLLKTEKTEGKGIKIVENPMQKIINEDTTSTKPEVKPTLDTFVNHSGGAVGSDTAWDVIGKSFGMINNNHYWMNNKTPNGNIEITEIDKVQGQTKVTIAARQMGRIAPTHQVRDERLIRNWSQVKYADAVFAVTTLLKVGEEMNYGKKALIVQGKGGTGYAVQMAINENKPVYVFDQLRKQWIEYNYSTKEWVAMTTVPTLTKNFAGIGTREINEAGAQAIKDVYAKASNITPTKVERVEPTIITPVTPTVEPTEPKGFGDIAFTTGGEDFDSRRGTRDISIKDKYFADNDVQTSTVILEKISESNHPLAPLAKKLLDFDTAIPVKLVYNDYMVRKFNGETVAGAYSTGSKSIVINREASFRGMGSEPTLIHEILHGLTNHELTANKEYTEQMGEFLEYAKAHGIVAGDSYALGNIDEFIVGLFTDAALISDLKSIPAMHAKEYRNLFEEVYSYILSLFGVTSKDKTLYEQAFALATNVVTDNYFRDLQDKADQSSRDQAAREYEEYTQGTQEFRLPEIKKCK